MVQRSVLGRGYRHWVWHQWDCQGALFFSRIYSARSVYQFSDLQIIQLSPSRRPTALLVLDPSPTPYTEGTPPPAPAPSTTLPPTSLANDSDSTPAPYAITSVAWAPSCGRSYHLIATGSRDGHVRIWRVKPGDEGGEPEEGESEGKWTASVVADFDHHKWVNFFLYNVSVADDLYSVLSGPRLAALNGT